MASESRIWTRCVVITIRVVFVLAVMSRRTWAYNCSRSLSPWIYINESYVKPGNPILYDGKPIRDILGWSRKRSSTFFTSPVDIIEWDASDGVRFRASFSVDSVIPWYVPLGSISLDYDVTCEGGENNSISIVLVDENDKRPNFTFSSEWSTNLSADTCEGQEVYNFAYQVRDPDFADKPNEEKLQLIFHRTYALVDIRNSEIDLGTFVISGRLGVTPVKPMNLSVLEYKIGLSLQDQAFQFGTPIMLSINVTKGSAINSSNSNRPENCTTLSDNQLGNSSPYDCSDAVNAGLLERSVHRGLQIQYHGHSVQQVSGLTRNYCTGLANSSFELLNLTSDGILVIHTDFNLDDVIQQGLYDAIYCAYNITCKGNSKKGSVNIYVVDENDEEPRFTADAPRILPMSQETELVYSFRGHVFDSDFADWPNDERLELFIVSPLLDSCGNSLPASASVTERLSLKVHPIGNVTRCSPYQLTIALKDHAMRIGPYHNVKFYDSDGDVYCAKRIVNISNTRMVTLPRIRAPSIVTPLCLSSGEPLLVAQCEQLSEDLPLAEYNVTLSTASCSDERRHSLLTDLYLVPLTDNNVINVTTELLNLTSTSSELLSEDLKQLSRILQNVYLFYENSTNATALLSNVSANCAEVVSNIMEIKSDVLERARNEDTMFTTRIVGSLDSMLRKLSLAIANGDTNATSDVQPLFQTTNLAYQVTTGRDVAGIGTCSYANATNTSFSLSYNSLTSECLNFSGSSGAELKLSTATRGSPRAFVVYNSATLFGTGAAPGAAVLSAQLTTEPVRSDSPNDIHMVTLRQKIDKATIKNGSRLICGYWNFSTKSWENDGCSREPTEDGQGTFICTCDHLTNFAVLMVPCVGKCGNSVHDTVLSYLSLIFLGISSVALFIVLVTFFAFRELRKSDGQRLTACLSATLLCMNLLFIFGINTANGNAKACSTLAVVLHFFLLSAFLLMNAEVILSYLLLVKVFGVHVSYFIWKVLAVCLGVPAVLVVSVRFAAPALYVRGDQYCWVQPTLEIYGVMLPVGLSIAFNLIMFILIARALSCRPQIRCSVSQRKLAIRQAKALAAIFVVLGITWSFGLLSAIEDSSIVFQYLFVISNALQGLLVFIFHNAKAPVILGFLKNAATQKCRGSTPQYEKDSNDATMNTGCVSGRHESEIGESDLSQLPKATQDVIGDQFSR